MSTAVYNRRITIFRCLSSTNCCTKGHTFPPKQHKRLHTHHHTHTHVASDVSDVCVDPVFVSPNASRKSGGSIIGKLRDYIYNWWHKLRLARASAKSRLLITRSASFRHNRLFNLGYLSLDIAPILTVRRFSAERSLAFGCQSGPNDNQTL